MFDFVLILLVVVKNVAKKLLKKLAKREEALWRLFKRDFKLMLIAEMLLPLIWLVMGGAAIYSFFLEATYILMVWFLLSHIHKMKWLTKRIGDMGTRPLSILVIQVITAIYVVVMYLHLHQMQGALISVLSALYGATLFYAYLLYKVRLHIGDVISLGTESINAKRYRVVNLTITGAYLDRFDGTYSNVSYIEMYRKGLFFLKSPFRKMATRFKELKVGIVFNKNPLPVRVLRVLNKHLLSLTVADVAIDEWENKLGDRTLFVYKGVVDPLTNKVLPEYAAQGHQARKFIAFHGNELVIYISTDVEGTLPFEVEFQSAQTGIVEALYRTQKELPEYDLSYSGITVAHAPVRT